MYSFEFYSKLFELTFYLSMILRQQESLFSTDSDSFQLKFNSNGDQDKPIITFEIDYSSIRIKNFLIPDNIDKLWNIIGSSSSYSRIYQTILDLDSDTIFSIFDNFNTSPFKQEFFELVEYASLIFPPEFVEIYLSQPKLDIELLIKQLPINSRALFCSYIQLVKIILQKFFDYSQKQIIVHKLANFLIPVNLP
ncbi:hypothetical protein TRFO_17611 [Tritrichomonas foetus]|uniref:Uncharacterized protein n=1 Tax=Tritrichomonas foetus TaxID=1144522 RepID=A0A1J4KNI9_9EUKA|nr:hypothetical protein TRFO_17611 [Tritrichomonas foetus]|eukprot:OHT12472.1 hypothetical protein TRFO_17611 [Tritrichomonas foetus]